MKPPLSARSCAPFVLVAILSIFAFVPQPHASAQSQELLPPAELLPPEELPQPNNELPRPKNELPPPKEDLPAPPPHAVKSDEPAGCAGKTDGKTDDKAKASPSFWEKNPPVRLLPRTGFFRILPTGPGYYSLTDAATHHCRDKPPNFPYSPISIMQNSFFDADFRYLGKPGNTQHDPLDCLHNIHCGPCWMFSTGGEFRYRFENRISGPGLKGVTDDLNLYRTRVFGDLWYGNALRVYVEMIDARLNGSTQPPAPIDINQADLLNAFVDLRLFQWNDHPAYVRVGRQELLLGSQRLISPLDWANTRRTFQGVRGFRQGEKFDFDVFYVQPVLPDPFRADWVDNNVKFGGAWTTYRPRKGETFDLYYLWHENRNTLKPLGVTAAPNNIQTIGSRWAGDKQRCDGPWRALWDFEGMVQVGDRGTSDLVAGAATASLGGNYSKGLNPTFWLCYDYASGSSGASGNNTFNQLFPFGHLYMGWIDAVARQNIHDVNMHLYVYPTKHVMFWAQYHHFWLASATDALYNAPGVAIRRDPTGKAGNNVGDEVDLVMNVHAGAHSDVALGYSKLFPGDFIRGTGSPRPPEFFWMQYSFRW